MPAGCYWLLRRSQDLMSEMKTIQPEEFESLDEIREGMDAIDRQIIALLARRVAHVKAAAKFKTTADSVAAPERVQRVLDTRREWAEAAGLDGDVVRGLYRDIVTYCVGEEKKHWERSQTL
jgi:isochorismate pyruvate lyase